MPPKCREARQRIRATGDTPVHELRHINPPLADLTFMHEYVSDSQFLGQLPLGKPGRLPKLAKHRREVSVAVRVLRFGHVGLLSPIFCLLPIR
jgi:hypothetical protein